jgi:tripartite-type tricarboxylate transporter receptor subunit TctC
MIKRSIHGFASMLFGLAALSGSVYAQDYPQKPVRLIVPFGPGSGADTIGRIIAERLGEELKGAVVADNREGAGGAIGATTAAKSPPDGYTLMLGVTTTVVSPYLLATAPYDPVKDFVPIAKVAELPLLMITASNAPYKSLKELIAYAKKNPGKLTYATSGKGSPSHLSVELIRRATGIDVVDVPYKSIGQATTDLLSGQVSFYFPAVTGATQQVLSGKARGLAIGATKRSQVLPDVPTVEEETGVKGLEVITWYGFLAPTGTPKPIVDRLSAAVLKVMASNDVQEKIRKTGADVSIGNADEFGALIRSDSAKYGKLISDLGLKATQ